MRSLMQKLGIIVILLISGIVLVANQPKQLAQAAFNPVFNYQGKLTNGSYVAVADGTYNMEFKLYDALGSGSPPTGGNLLWTETRTGANKVQVTNGLFNVMLGEVTSLSGVDFNKTLFLSVNIGGTGSPSWDGEMAPRKKVGAVPAAFVANSLVGTGSIDITNTTTPQASLSYDTSDKLTVGVASNGFTTLTVAGSAPGLNLTGGNVGINTSSISAKLQVTATTEQFRVSYDGSNYSSFTADSGGDLTIAPSGGDLNVTGNVDVSGALTAGTGNAFNVNTSGVLTAGSTGAGFTIALGTSTITGILSSTYGGTGNGFTKFSGPTTSEKTFTLPNSSATLLYDGGALGTPSSGVATNLTGTASGLTSGKATNLVGGNNTTLLGSIPYQSNTDTTTLLSPNTSSTKKFLSQTGTGVNGAVPAWTTLSSTDVGLGNVENTALSTWAGSANITTLGTVATGTWSASTIAVNKGGTGQTSYTDGQLLIGNTTGNTLTLGTISNTANQTTVTNGHGTIQIGTVQDIATTSNPQFGGLGIGTTGSAGKIAVAQTSNAAGLTVTGSSSETGTDLVTFSNAVLNPSSGSANSILNLTYTNASTIASPNTSSIAGLTLNPTLNVSSGTGTHNTFGINLGTVATNTCAAGTCPKYAIYAGSGNNWTDLLNYNGTSLISAAGLINAAQLTGTVPSGSIVGTYGSLTGTGTLTAGATGSGFTVALGTSTITGILGSANGGTGNGFTKFSGPTTAEKTFTLPDASATILTSNAAVTVAQGGTGIASGTSGGIPYFSGTGTMASSGLLTANALLLGGGTGVAPSVLGSLGTSTTILHGNASGAPSFSSVVGGDLASNINISTTGTIATTSSGTITSASTLTASNGLTLSTGALNLTGTSGSIALTGFGTSSVTSTTTTGTLNALTDSTAQTGALVGQSITLSGTGAFDQTGLQFNLSNASGTNLNDIVGTGSTWKISRAGALTVSSCSGCGGGGGTLQTAYGSGNTITTTSGNDVAITLASGLGTATAFTVTNNHVSASKALYISGNNASGTVTNGLVFEQTGAGTTTSGLNVTRTAGTLTNGLVFNGTIGTDITSTDTNKALTISATGTGALTLNGGGTGAVNITGNGASLWKTTSGALTITSAAGNNISSTSADLALSTTTSGNITFAPASTGSVKMTLGTTTGTGTTAGLSLASSTLTSGSLADLTVSGGNALGNQTALNISTSGAVAGASTTYGAQISNTHTGATATNVGLTVSASGATTANYAIIVPAGGGRVGIGTATPTDTLEVSSSADTNIQVTSTSSNTAAITFNQPNYTTWTMGMLSSLGDHTFVLKDTAVRLKVDGRTTTNQIYNASFEQNIHNWVAKGTPTTGPVWDNAASNAKYGSGTLKFSGDAVGDGAQYSYPFAANAPYAATFWAKTASGTATLRLDRQDNGSDVGGCSDSAVTTTWTEFTCTFTTGATINTSTSNIFIKQNAAGTPTVYIDGFTLIPGSSTMDYTAPGNNIQVDANYGNITLNAAQNADIQPWQSNSTPVPTARRASASVTANGFAYMIGGTTANGTSGGAYTTILYGRINADGSLTPGSWTQEANNNLLPGVYGHASFVANGYLYVIGGCTDTSATAACTTPISTVKYSKLNSDGSLGSWQTNATGIPAARGYGTAIFSNGYVYYIGGYNATAQTTVYSGRLNADGSISGWTTTGVTALGSGRYGQSTMNVNGKIYSIGGCSDAGGLCNTALTTVEYATPANDGTLGAWTAATSLPVATGFHTTGILNGYLFNMGGRQAGAPVATVYYAKVNSVGPLGAWATSTNPLPAARQQATSLYVNTYLYNFNGYDGTTTLPASAFFASGARVSIFGGLDLLGLTSQTLTDYSGGGALTAGNTRVVGDLRVDGFADLNNGLTVDSVINLNAVSAVLGQNVFNVNNSSSNSIFNIKHMGSNFGGLAITGAFMDKNSYFGEEFNVFKTTNCAPAATANTIGSVFARGDWQGGGGAVAACAPTTGPQAANTGELGVSIVGGTTLGGTCKMWQPSNTTQYGVEEILATGIATASTKANCLEYLSGGTTAGAPYKPFAANNLPVFTAKVKAAGTGLNANANSEVIVGLSDLGAGQNGMPSNGVFFSNCTTYSTTAPTCPTSSNSWQGYVASGGALVGSVQICSGTLTTTAYAYLRIEVRSNSDIHFFVDVNTSDGIVETECGSGVTAAGPGATALGLTLAANVNSNAAVTTILDIDYVRVWQDDPPDQPATPASGIDPVVENPLQVADITPDTTFDAKQFLAGLMTQTDPETASANTQAVAIEQTQFDRLIAKTEIVTPKITANGLTIDSIGALGKFISVLSDMHFIGRPYFNSDTAGFAKFKEGDSKVTINFDSAYLTQPIINIGPTLESDPSYTKTTDPKIIDKLQKEQEGAAQSLFDADVQYLVINKNEKGFTIILNKPAPRDLMFSWIALAVKDAKISLSDGKADTPEPGIVAGDSTSSDTNTDTSSGSATETTTDGSSGTETEATPADSSPSDSSTEQSLPPDSSDSSDSSPSE